MYELPGSYQIPVVLIQVFALGTMKMDATPCSMIDFLLTFEKSIVSIFVLPFYPEEGGSTFLRTCSKEATLKT
jgi:hypothetical protein